MKKTPSKSKLRVTKQARVVNYAPPVSEEQWILQDEKAIYHWSNAFERIAISREGISYSAIETISGLLNTTVKAVLEIIQIPQTTYNKKKAEKALLETRNSELVLLITELITFGHEAFNGEQEKFQRWLHKSNPSLGGAIPAKLLDTTSGIEEVRNALYRIQYGIYA